MSYGGKYHQKPNPESTTVIKEGEEVTFRGHPYPIKTLCRYKRWAVHDFDENDNSVGVRTHIFCFVCTR